MGKPRVLVGGVPFGCDNVGDEAILECVVRIVREECPGAQITVSTNDPGPTARKLGLDTVELFGFDEPYDTDAMARALVTHDAFVWAGATGLSDYPEIPLDMLRIAREAGTRTILWGVGMNHTLNPVKYTVLPGKRRCLLKAITASTLGLFDAVGWEEARRVSRARGKIRDRLAAADLVVVRDPESRDEVLRCGPGPDVLVGADSALLMQPCDLGRVALPDKARDLLSQDGPKIGLCVSAQREIRGLERLVALLDSLVEDGMRIIFLPMNPVTDSALMERLQQDMNHPEGTALVHGRYEPNETLAVAAQLDVVISSRLHLLILASIAHVPIVGVSRGSKVDNYLAPYGLSSVGSVEDCDFERLETEARRLAGKDGAAFRARSREVYEMLIGRLDAARPRLRQVLAAAGGNA